MDVRLLIAHEHVKGQTHDGQGVGLWGGSSGRLHGEALMRSVGNRPYASGVW